MTKEELADLREWVKAGGALAGTHSRHRHPIRRVGLRGLDRARTSAGTQRDFRSDQGEGGRIRKHPAGVGFENGMDYQDEMYVFRDAPYSREKLHIILSIEADSFKPGGNLTRKDGDYAISWCREEGKGKVFYTSFGHSPKVWQDEKFQKHLFGGLKWATGELKGDATPSAKKE